MLAWLGREDSNLRMAESKSDRFHCKINVHSEKLGEFVPRSVNSLAPISEWSVFPASHVKAGARCRATAPRSGGIALSLSLLALEIRTQRGPAKDSRGHSQARSRDERCQPLVGSATDAHDAGQYLLHALARRYFLAAFGKRQGIAENRQRRKSTIDSNPKRPLA